MRLRDWWILLMADVAGWVWGLTLDRHLTTDPLCVAYRAPGAGSRLDRASRGVSCSPCLARRAWMPQPDPESHVSRREDEQ